jgi:ABC-2 type transport system permease protein
VTTASTSLRYTRLYRHFLVMQLKTLVEYRASFVIGAAGTLAVQAAGVAGLWVVLRRVPSVGGWGFEELLLLTGLLISARGLEHTFADNLWVLGHTYIRLGSFDRFLVRPVDPLFHLLADRFNLDGVGDLVVGIGLVAWSWTRLELPLGVVPVGFALVAVLAGGAIFVALNLLTATTAFWFVESVPATRAVHELHEIARYPLSIYGRKTRLALTWVVPYGLASFFPASHLLGRDVGLTAFAAVPVAVALNVVAYRFWRVGLARYRGAGS